MGSPLNIAFVWHMHQPYYLDRHTRIAIFPWVRLHVCKDYFDMVTILEDYPHIKQTFNLVPSLLDQLNQYAKGDVRDYYLEISAKPARELTSSDKIFILSRFCPESWQPRIGPYKRYKELILKKEALGSKSYPEMIQEFSEEEYQDLQVWFNLAWFDPLFLEKDDFLKECVEKDRNFTEMDKIGVIEKQMALVEEVVPTYRHFQEEGKIEITTSPFYHPIVPLLCDSEVAREALPDVDLPSSPFRYPEDARKQVEMGLECYRHNFSHSPRGMWPPEQAVSEEAVRIMMESGVEWIISDEEVLANSLGTKFIRDGQGNLQNPEDLYRAYQLQRGDRELKIIFRDHFLSDLIGFVYGSKPGRQAAEELYGRLKAIKVSLGDRAEKHLVTIALDGENCWEHYDRDGYEFLTNLYRLLNNDPELKVVTVSEYLDKAEPKSHLDKIWSGSWINANFGTWIGSRSQARAWDYLYHTRSFLTTMERQGQVDKETAQRAWEEIYVAEGSDWFWWFGDYHHSGLDQVWDSQFRSHLRAVYRILNEQPPEHLFEPIISKDEAALVVQRTGPMHHPNQRREKL